MAIRRRLARLLAAWLFARQYEPACSRSNHRAPEECSISIDNYGFSSTFTHRRDDACTCCTLYAWTYSALVHSKQQNIIRNRYGLYKHDVLLQICTKHGDASEK
jgi:ADP-ribosylglycohydrolase